jgi:Fic/DOC family
MTGSGVLEAGAATLGAAGEVYVPVSDAGDSIKNLVGRPIQQRIPVGYNRDFIGAYVPNRTYYLSEDVRAHLLAIGRSGQEALPAGTHALRVFQRLLIDLSWNSSRLEGNTYSLLETERLLEIGQDAQGKDARETQMILNHKSAIAMLVESAAEIGFNRYTVCNLHALLAENLLPDPAAYGRLRERGVGITGSVYHPLEGGAELARAFDDLLHKAASIQDPFEQAFFAMMCLPYLQPFDDVNKRVSRLAANIPFIRANLSPLSFVDVPQSAYVDGLLGVYELNRTELLRDVFVWAYERSGARYSAIRQSIGEADPFRLRYRSHIAQLVGSIVADGINRTAAIAAIRQYANKSVAEVDRARFTEVAETELMSLHEGNIARYRLRPSQFEAWKSAWT